MARGYHPLANNCADIVILLDRQEGVRWFQLADDSRSSSFGAIKQSPFHHQQNDRLGRHVRSIS